MWNLNEYKRLFYAVALIGLIACFVPNVTMLVSLPAGEKFSELYVLGQDHMAENYPFNVSVGGNYLVYLGVENHLGSSMYYGVEVKFRNASDPLPDNTVPSSSPALYEYRVFLSDSQAWEGNLTFSFSDVVFDRTQNMCSVGEVRVNNIGFQLGKVTIWDNENSGFYYQVFVELWLFNETENSLSYDGRYVSLWLNMTSPV